MHPSKPERSYVHLMNLNGSYQAGQQYSLVFVRLRKVGSTAKGRLGQGRHGETV